MTTPSAGEHPRVVRVNGPLVEVTGLDHVAMLDVVSVGPHAVPGEVVSIDGRITTLQTYEYNGGLRVGDAATPSGRPLSARLGPGLIGRVFDGLLRPLSDAPVWLSADRPHATTVQRWPFSPRVSAGEAVTPGAVLGIVANAGAVEHRVLAPPPLAGTVTWVAANGEVGEDEAVARIRMPQDETEHEITLVELWPIRRARPHAGRVEQTVPLNTGQRVLDLIFPLGRGSSAAVPGGFGTGKTVLLQQIAKWCDADVIVYVGCGERGNEMADVLDEFAQLTDPRTSGPLLDRTVILANTSNMPMMARESSVYSGLTVAEYFRDMGHDTVVIADSTSRWAEALREFASRTGALPAEEGYPSDLASALAGFYERAGMVRTLGGSTASVSIVGAVSPPGGDLTEPVTTDTQRFVSSVWSLDRDLAYARHYPAVSWQQSFSREITSLGTWHAGAGDAHWAQRRARAAALLGEADRISALAEIVGVSGLPGPERIALLAGRLLREGVLAQSALSPNDAFCSLAKGAALLDLVLDVVDVCQRLVDRGVQASSIEELDFSPVVRAREESGPEDAEAVHRRRDDVVASLEDMR